MADPRLQSLHLEGQPRRDQFRAAREAMHAGCGALTIGGGGRLMGLDERLDGETAAPRPSTGRFLFYLKDGTDVFPLHVGMNSVGRLPDNDVVIRDECVSRRHCAVVVHSDLRCELHDVASKNGTHLNGKTLAGPTRLRSGDNILLCNHRLTFHVSDSPEPAAG